MTNELLKRYKKRKYFKLILAIIIDLVGATTYFIPAIGESGDLIWGPISGLLIFMIFPKHRNIAIGGAFEELLPFTDFVPAALIAWSLDYIKDNKKTLAEFEEKEVHEQ